MAKYSLGLDYGTLSGRALLVNVETGEEVAISVFEYPHKVMDEALPCGKKLGSDWALQHPQDYIDVLKNTIPDVIKTSGVNPKDIIGVGVDFTTCSPLPVKKDGTPLCFIDKYKCEPHAYVKLWKHHAAQDKANKINEIAEKMGEKWLKRYGGKISSEWLIPKLWQILDEKPEIFDEMDYFMESADWIVWQLTGNYSRNSCTAGYKAIWNKQEGYPDKHFFKALDSRLEDVVSTKLNCEIRSLGQKAGEITDYMASTTGLIKGTPVAVALGDAHAGVPAVKIDGPNKMLMIMGTSTCHMLLSDKEVMVSGISGCVEDGLMPGYFGYEAGQACVGDHFEWFVENCIPEKYSKEAKVQNKNIHVYLQEKMMQYAPGETGLIALDWWNGNRTPLVDGNLTGMMLGMTLKTKPEEMYKALIESTAYGTRKIIDTFEEGGITIDEVYATGGIAEKSPAIMRIYADIIKKPIKISGTSQGPALGSAVFGAVVGGAFDNVFEGARVLGKIKDTIYMPDKESSVIYDKLFAEYDILHKYFGEGINNVMKRLKAL